MAYLLTNARRDASLAVAPDKWVADVFRPKKWSKLMNQTYQMNICENCSCIDADPVDSCIWPRNILQVRWITEEPLGKRVQTRGKTIWYLLCSLFYHIIAEFFQILSSNWTIFIQPKNLSQTVHSTLPRMHVINLQVRICFSTAALGPMPLALATVHALVSLPIWEEQNKL